MRPIAADGVALSVGLSVMTVGPAETAERNHRSKWRLDMNSGRPANYMLDENPDIPHGKGHFWGTWRWDFPTRRRGRSQWLGRPNSPHAVDQRSD